MDRYPPVAGHGMAALITAAATAPAEQFGQAEAHPARGDDRHATPYGCTAPVRSAVGGDGGG